MEQNRLNRRADLAIVLVALVTAVVSLGPWRFRVREIDESPADGPAARQRFSERCASDSLRTLAAEEADFRGCDREWNHVNDFWSADVTGLFSMTTAETTPADDEGEPEE